MTIAQESTPRKTLRLWPGVLAAALLVLARFGVPLVVPEGAAYGVMGALAAGLLIVLWWLFFSRAPWTDRLAALVLMAVALFATQPILHESVRGGMMGMMFPVLAFPLLCLALVVWAVASRRLSAGARRATMAATILLACGAWALVRTGGITGDADSDLHWRWSQTPEERLLARAGDEPAALPAPPPAAATSGTRPAAETGEAPAVPASAPATAETPEQPQGAQADNEPEVPRPVPALETGADWPGIRGPQRDGVTRGARIAADWSAAPPVELWRKPVGPGWSSFAVSGNFLYTQEQRGDDEVVSCYNATTGEPVWRHRDAARFYESNAGAGPRATPTVSNGRVYTLGATGIVNALDAGTGAVVWSRNAASDTGAAIPGWGFAGSPLVVDDVVIVATAGKLAAYDAATGEPRWLGPGPAADGGYSSPHLATLGGVPQVLFLNVAGALGLAPADGRVLWEYPWKGDGIVQPALTSDGDVLLGSGSGMGGDVGVRRIAVGKRTGGWKIEERWTSIGLKPYFNDFVVHEGHAFGFDGSRLACIDLKDGKRKWKDGHYGHGQLVLLPDQDLLLVLTEKGELALVGATPDQFTELARVPAIEGKTWNHPVLVGDVLLVRNDHEMAAFRLARASSLGVVPSR